MTSAASFLCVLILTASVDVETRFAQVHPVPKKDAEFLRSREQIRAVILIHGFRAQPLEQNVAHAGFHSWQKAGRNLVKALGKHADVFAFAYGQNVALDEIVAAPGLAESVRRLRKLGYSEIVLVGHSAGGVIARHFVEDHADAGVTKVIQVCSPNCGSGWAETLMVRSAQKAFFQSLGKEARQKCLKQRVAKKIPDSVEFVCIVGTGLKLGDGVVNCESQWSEDLQRQGIPACPCTAVHFSVMRSESGTAKIAELVSNKQPRWDATQVAKTKERLAKATKENQEP